MIQQSGALVPAEVPISVPSTNLCHLSNTCKSSSRGFVSVGTHPHPHALTPIPHPSIAPYMYISHAKSISSYLGNVSSLLVICSIYRVVIFSLYLFFYSLHWFQPINLIFSCNAISSCTNIFIHTVSLSHLKQKHMPRVIKAGKSMIVVWYYTILDVVAFLACT